jgi:LysM repeat protein
MDQDQVIRGLKRQLLIERIILALIVLLLVGRWLYLDFDNRHYVIYVNDKPVAALATEQAANAALDSLRREVNPARPGDVAFAETVRVQQAFTKDMVTEQDAVKLLKGKLTVRLMKYVILADEQPVVAVDSEIMAGQVLEGVKQRFGGMVENLMEEPGFKQKVTVKRMPIDEAIYAADVDSAINAATSSAGTQSLYSVRKGDMAGSIARKFNLKLSDLQVLNGGRNLDKLQIGDQIRVSTKQDVKRPRLIVVVRDKESGTEVTPYNTVSVSSTQLKPGKQVELNPGRNGLRRVTRAVTYENGIRTGMEVIEEKLIRSAVPRRIAVGIRP